MKEEEIRKLNRKIALYKKKMELTHDVINDVITSIYHKEVTIDEVYKKLNSIGGSMRIIHKEHLKENKRISKL